MKTFLIKNHTLIAFFAGLICVTPSLMPLLLSPKKSGAELILKFFFAFFTVWGFYNCQRTVGYQKGKVNLKSEKSSFYISIFSLILGVSSLLGMGYLSSQEGGKLLSGNVVLDIFSNFNLVFFAILWMVGLSYNIPLFENRMGTRNIFIMKPLMIATAWTSLALIDLNFIYDGSVDGQIINGDIIYKILIYFPFFYILSISTQIRDIRKLNEGSPAQLIIYKIISVIFFLFSFSLFIIGLKNIETTALLFIALIPLIYSLFYTKKISQMTYLMVIESSMFLVFFIVLVGKS